MGSHCLYEVCYTSLKQEIRYFQELSYVQFLVPSVFAAILIMMKCVTDAHSVLPAHSLESSTVDAVLTRDSSSQDTHDMTFFMRIKTDSRCQSLI